MLTTAEPLQLSSLKTWMPPLLSAVPTSTWILVITAVCPAPRFMLPNATQVVPEVLAFGSESPLRLVKLSTSRFSAVNSCPLDDSFALAPLDPMIPV
jgi:hypothetical protein